MVEANIRISKHSSQSFKRSQFPLTHACACAVHKFQGHKLSTTVVSLELVKQRTFSPGQICVALSQSKYCKKLNILSNFDPKIVKL